MVITRNHLLCFIILSSNYLARLVSGEFVLNLSPVEFEGVRRPDSDGILAVNLEVTQPGGGAELMEGNPTMSCSNAQGPWGNDNTVAIGDESDSWKIRISLTDYYLKLDRAPSGVTLLVNFGDNRCSVDASEIESTQLPKGYSLEESLEESYVENMPGDCPNWIEIKAVLTVEGTECNILVDNKEHALEFEVDEPIIGTYKLSPCFAFLRLDGVAEVEYKSVQSAPNAGRLLQDGEEEETCIYCTSLPCPCCPSDDNEDPPTKAPTTDESPAAQFGTRPSSGIMTGLALGTVMALLVG